MAAEHRGESYDDAKTQLMQHISAEEDLSVLNNGQRIILASHRFAPEVTSAALWLNQQAHGEGNLITCIKLTPHHDAQTGALYVQASTIIPVPGAEQYLVGVGRRPQSEPGNRQGGLRTNLAATFARNKNDEVSQFAKKVGRLAIDNLPSEIRPDKLGRWAGDGGGRRYYHLWYSRAPWGNWKINYSMDLHHLEESGKWRATVLFENYTKIPLSALDGISLETRRNENRYGIYNFAIVGPDTLNDNFANQIAETLREFIVQITPIVNDLENEGDGDDEA